MPLSIKRTLLILAMLLGVLPAQAQLANIYYAPAFTGSNNGTNCSNAYAATDASNGFNVAAKWGSGGTQIGANTTVHLCGGTYSYGAGTVSSLKFQGGGTSGNPVTLLADQGAVTITALYWGTNAAGIDTAGNSNIIINGMNQLTVKTTANGDGQANQVDGGNGILAKGGSNVTVENLSIGPIYIHVRCPSGSCTSVGAATGDISANGNNILIQNISGTDAKDCLGLNWPAGVSYSGLTAKNNTCRNMDHGIEIGNSNTTGSNANILIQGNDIANFSNWDDQGTECSTSCWFHHDGIHQFSYNGNTVSGYVVNGNYIHGDFGSNINAGIFQESSTGTTGTVYINNIVADGATFSHLGCGEICIENTGAVIYNNTVTSTAGNASVCFAIYYMNDVVWNNVCENMSTAIIISNSFNALKSNTSVDYNSYYNFTSPSNAFSNGTWAGWQASTCANGPCDQHSTLANPNLNSSFQPTSFSTTVIQQACNLTNQGITALDSDFAGTARPNATGCQTQGTSLAWDKGAYVYSTAMPPAGPAAVMLLSVNIH